MRPERRYRCATVYEVLQGDLVVCSWKMGLSKREAQNKVRNEYKRNGQNGWRIMPVIVRKEMR